MIKRFALLAAAGFVLSGCCGGTQGYIHPTPGTRDNWGRLVAIAHQPKPAVPRKKRAAVHPASSSMEEASPQEAALDGLKPYSREWWSVRDALDRASEAKLGQKLIICRDCMPSPQDDQTGSIPAK